MDSEKIFWIEEETFYFYSDLLIAILIYYIFSNILKDYFII